MKEHSDLPGLSHHQLQKIMDSLLAIPRKHKLIHPCQDRTRYAHILEWLVSSISGLKKQYVEPQELAVRQQQLILASLTELIDLTGKECMQKGLILEMVLEYFTGTLNSYWQLFRSVSKQISYEFSHNALKIQQDYMSQLKRLQQQNQELRKDKEHRWRNMFMLIKDNRIMRKKNKKLMKTVDEQIERGRAVAEQMLGVQVQGEKMKIKISQYEVAHPEIMDFMEANIDFCQLQNKIRMYPQKAKKLLKSQLLKIQINQTKDLKDKIAFIINAIEQTGEIIDDIYEDDLPNVNYHYNISTQTELYTDDRGVNTIALRTCENSTHTSPHEHALLSQVDTVSVKVPPTRKQKKEGTKQIKNAMFASTHSLSRLGFTTKKEEQKSRNKSFKAQQNNFSVCESLKITIWQNRISYISTYNTEIFNGIQIVTQIEKKVEAQIKLNNRKKQRKVTQAYVQTVQNHEIDDFSYQLPSIMNMTLRPTCKSLARIKTFKELGITNQPERKKYNNVPFFQISQESHFYYDPQDIKAKQLKAANNSDKSSLRSSMAKKINKQRVFERKTDKQVKFAKRVVTEGKENKRDSIESTAQKIFNDIKYSKTSAITEHINETLNESALQMQQKNKQFTSEEASTMLTAANVKEIRSNIKNQQFSNTQQIVVNNNNFGEIKNKRNQSSIIAASGIKKLQSNRILGKQDYNQKRSPTESNDLDPMQYLHPQPSIKLLNPGHPRPLNRISQDFSQQQYRYQTEQFPSALSIRSGYGKIRTSKILYMSKDVDSALKDIDFTKNIDKILKNMEVRGHEIIQNTCTFKSFVSSHFRCHFGKELYSNFINFLSNAPINSDQVVTTFSRLINPKLPEGYSADIFKTFAATVKKCYQVNENPLSSRHHFNILKYLVSQYYEEEQATCFQKKMRKQGCLSLIGWFNALELEIRQKILQSQLYGFLCDITVESEDGISVGFVEDLAVFISDDPLVHQHLIKAKFQLGNKTAIHRFCFFCLRNQWHRIINIKTTISQQYTKCIGNFSQQKSLKKIQANLPILAHFKHIERSLKQSLKLHERYNCEISKYLLMLCELTILEYILRDGLPISKELRCLNLAFKGLEKKSFYEEMKVKMDVTGG